MNTTRTALDHLADARQMVLRALDPSLSETDRSVRARTAGEHVTDLRDLIRWGALIGTGATVDAISDTDDAHARSLARAALAELRATITSSDLYQQLPTDVAAPPTGLGAFPLVREYATPNTQTQRFVVPDMPTGNVDGYVVVRGQAVPAQSATPFTIDDETTFTRFTAGAYAIFSLLLVDGLTDLGSAYVDQVMADIADRTSEKKIVELLLAAAPAATAVASGNIAAALDTAEGLAGTAAQGPVDLAVVSPGDWPKIRRALGNVWQQQPAPSVAVSAGMPAGTALLANRDAFLLYATPLRTARAADRNLPDGYLIPSNFSKLVLADRDLQLAVRKATGLRKVTGI